MSKLLKLALGAGILIGATGLSGCSSTTDRTLRTDNANTGQRVLTANPTGEVIGNGKVRVALLVPTTIPGGAATIAQQLRNGAAMAMSDFGQNRLQLVIKDTKGQAAEAQAQAGTAIAEGASLILGPLFAANVSAAAGVTIPANVPVLAFSTDTTVARRGTYLFSYTPQSDTRRFAEYAVSIGRKSIAAFLPRNAEGSLRGRILREVATRAGVTVTIFEYDRTPEGIEAIIASAALGVEGADSVYIPEGGPLPGLVINGLSRQGISLSGKQLFGSGSWETLETNDPAVEGAIYPGRDTSRFVAFADRYEQQFGSRPGVQAALAYDATTLAAELVRINGPERAFSASNFESARGFQGTTGAFRILRDGTTQRGLALYRIQSGQRTLLEPAISGFSRRVNSAGQAASQ